jgi:hypothetical protein
MKQLLFLLFLAAAVPAVAQQTDSGYVNVHADPRIAAIVSKPANANRAFIGKVRGFRVQIYNGNDRKKASQIKLDFMKMFPGIRSYLVYNNPQFRIRVGDFRSRKEALDLYNKLSARFNPSMVVPDVVNINTVRKTKDNSEEEND